ncbi:MAG: hypothetical protein AAF492_04045 [Verrucomicrobiota bacterium]
MKRHRVIDLLRLSLFPAGLIFAEEPVERKEAWQTDVVAFNRLLGELAGRAAVPDPEELKDKIEDKPGRGREAEVVTDGAGGVVDLTPAEGTLQFVVNRMFRGKTVDWKMDIQGGDTGWTGVTSITPKFTDRVLKNMEDGPFPFLVSIELDVPGEAEFIPGERLRVKGKIGDFNSNGRDLPSLPTGLVAIYYLEDLPHPIFWLVLSEATITRFGPDGKPLPMPARKPLPDPAAKDPVEVAKARYFAVSMHDEKTLAALYASRVRLMPGHVYLKEPDHRVKGLLLDRKDMLATVLKSVPRTSEKFLHIYLKDLRRFESLDVSEGDFAVGPYAPVKTPDRKIYFTIQPGDALIKMTSVNNSITFLQLRLREERWQVVSEAFIEAVE